MKTIQVGIFGVGSVGSGVIDLIRINRSLLSERLGFRVAVKTAVVRDASKSRSIDLSGIHICEDPNEIFEDTELDLIIEAIGGKDLSMQIAEHCHAKKIPLITANKALLAEESAFFAQLYASEKNYLGYDASVAGSIPILKTLHYGLCANEITEIKSIINGTANYILTSMEEEGTEMQVALENAQKLGYAEPDPTFDVDGHDTGHKLCILIGHAFHRRFPFEKMHIEGIRGISQKDVVYAHRFGFRIKLLGIANITPAGIEGRVHPALLKQDTPLASVRGVSNSIYVKGNFCGPGYSTGLGAGSHPTASAIMADFIRYFEIYQKENSESLKYFFEYPEAQTIPIQEIQSAYYLRAEVENLPGVLASISGLLAKNNISIIQVNQEKCDALPESPVDLVILTERCRESDIKNAVKLISAQDYCKKKITLIRIEEGES